MPFFRAIIKGGFFNNVVAYLYLFSKLLIIACLLWFILVFGTCKFINGQKFIQNMSFVFFSFNFELLQKKNQVLKYQGILPKSLYCFRKMYNVTNQYEINHSQMLRFISVVCSFILAAFIIRLNIWA